MTTNVQKLSKEMRTAAGQYAVAINVSCPFCSVPAGSRCTGVVLPQYPHNARIEKVLNIPEGQWVNLSDNDFE